MAGRAGLAGLKVAAIKQPSSIAQGFNPSEEAKTLIDLTPQALGVKAFAIPKDSAARERLLLQKGIISKPLSQLTRKEIISAIKKIKPIIGTRLLLFSKFKKELSKPTNITPLPSQAELGSRVSNIIGQGVKQRALQNILAQRFGTSGGEIKFSPTK